MSVEGGSISTGIGTAVAVATVPSISGEISHAASVGSFSPSLNASLFSETRPFAASLGSVPEGPIAKSSDGLVSKSTDFFSSDWMTLGRSKDVVSPTAADVLDVPTMEKSADSLQSLGFEPYIAEPVTIAEKTVVFNEREFITLAKAPAKTIAETVFPETKPLLPENAVFSKNITDNDLTILVESAYKQVPKEKSVLEESLIAEKEQAEKVENLLMAVGLYTRLEARKRVAKIAEKKALAVNKTEAISEIQSMSSALGKIEIEEEAEVSEEAKLEAKTQSKTQPEATATADGTRGVVILPNDQIERVEPKGGAEKPLKEKPSKEVPVVDEKAQVSRKKEIKERISGLFSKARWFGLEGVNSGEIVKDLEKNSANRSLLLNQLWYPFLPDGSLDEIAKTVESAGEIGDVSEIAQLDIEKWTEAVVDRNTAVKLAEGSSPQVSDKDVKRVLKYIQPESLFG
jgi:hypothetical protein